MAKVGPGKPPEEHRFKPGQSGNPKGKKKGTKNLSTIVRELEAEDFDWALVPVKQKDAIAKIGSPWRAIVYTAVAKAVSGEVKAMEWLRRAGYGDKLDLTTSEKPLTALVEFVGKRKKK